MEMNWPMVALFLYMTGLINTGLLLVMTVTNWSSISTWRTTLWLFGWPFMPITFLIALARGKV